MPSQHLATPNYNLKRIKKDDANDGIEEPASYSLASKPDVPRNQYNSAKPAIDRSNIPAVSNFNPNMAPQKQGIIRRFLTTILGSDEEASTTDASSKDSNANIIANTSNTRFSNNNRTHNNNNRNRNNRNRDNRDNRERDNREQRGPRPVVNTPAPAAETTTATETEITADGTTSIALPRKRNSRRHQYRKRGGNKNVTASPESTISPATSASASSAETTKVSNNEVNS